MPSYFFDHIYLAQGWAQDVSVRVDQSGTIVEVKKNTRPGNDVQQVSGYAIPGIVNAHSHAFQRAMVGLSEYRVHAQDSFWSWRDLMYRLASQVNPDDLYAIGNHLYIEMLKAGYTRVAEFHYLHHQPSGQPYLRPEEMSLNLLEAAKAAGIGICLLPVLYQYSDFASKAAETKQLRFVHSVDDFQRLLSGLKQMLDRNEYPNASLGIAFHSLRAVSKESIVQMLQWVDATMPIHIHIAEQLQEVKACQAMYGARPVEWLLQHFDINERWCLVHATHIKQQELISLAKSQAVVSICTTTEANLGDGIFPMQEYLNHSGSYAIGSDSQVSLSPIEELRWLEYGQRLVLKQRNIICSESSKYCGERLLNDIWQGGAQACGHKLGAIAVGYQADILVLDEAITGLQVLPKDHRLDAFIFGGNHNIVRDVMVAGKWCVQGYHHEREHDAKEGFLKVMANLKI